MGDFKQLRAWQEAKKLAVLSKAAIAKLPRDEPPSATNGAVRLTASR